MPRSSPPNPVTPAEWILEHATGPAAVAAEQAPESVRAALNAILNGAAATDTTEDGLSAIQIAYHTFASTGGTPRQKRRSLRVLQGGV